MNKLLISPVTRIGEAPHFRVWSPRLGVETHSFATTREASIARQQLMTVLRDGGLQFEPYRTREGFEQAVQVAEKEPWQ